VNENIKVIQREQEVYRRLDHCEGVVPCLGFSPTTIRLAYMKHGDMRSFLKKNQSSRPLQLSWFRQMAHALSHMHRRSIIVADIASRNLLLDRDLSVKFCDFTESTIMPPDVDMEDVDDNGYSIQTDIGQLGAIIYEVVTGERCEFDLFKDNPPDATDAVWPRRETLPCTKNIWLGSIIEKCWTKDAFQNANQLAEALDAIELEESEIEENNRLRKTTIL
jgi:serine/threonine protein kinase